jgi:acetyltransferase
MKNLFEPRGIAVVGASHHPTKIGYRVVENIIKGGYKGGVYPINPKAGKIAGVDACTSIHEVIGHVDVAVITIPAAHVMDAVKSCAKKHVKYLIIITSGFSEIGNTAEEKKVVGFARENGMRVLGPNVFGFYSSKVSLNASFGPSEIKPGNVSIITQSGAIGIAMVGKTRVENIGLSSIISVGNKADIDETALLSYLMTQDDTRMILMYIEGIKGGSRLVEVLSDAARRKPVVVIKSGRSAKGAMAAASHTGSLAGADKVFDDIVKQCGVIRAERIEEALDWCKFLANSPAPKGSNTVIITNGGGVGVLAADACEKYGLHLYDDLNVLKKAFSDSVPDFGSTKNPIDLTGAATDKDYDHSLTAALKNKQIGSVICLGCETAIFDAEKFTGMVRKVYSAYKSIKPVVFSAFGGAVVEKGIDRLRKEAVPIFSDVYTAVSCLGVLHSYHNRIDTPEGDPDPLKIDVKTINRVVKDALAKGRNFLLAHEGQEVMGAIGIRIPKSRIARNIDAAVGCAEEIGYPVAMKVMSKDILHKSDVGGVALELDNRNEVVEAFESIMHSCRAHVPNAHIEGVEIGEMIETGVETIVGARVDRSFGPVVMFGLGGVYVEVMKDVSFRAFPLSRAEVLSMVSEIKSYPLLLGVRGEDRKDIDGVVDAICKVGTVIEKCPDITDIEINPLSVYDQGNGVKAVDVRIMLKGVNR